MGDPEQQLSAPALKSGRSASYIAGLRGRSVEVFAGRGLPRWSFGQEHGGNLTCSECSFATKRKVKGDSRTRPVRGSVYLAVRSKRGSRTKRGLPLVRYET